MENTEGPYGEWCVVSVPEYGNQSGLAIAKYEDDAWWSEDGDLTEYVTAWRLAPNF